MHMLPVSNFHRDEWGATFEPGVQFSFIHSWLGHTGRFHKNTTICEVRKTPQHNTVAGMASFEICLCSLCFDRSNHVTLPSFFTRFVNKQCTLQAFFFFKYTDI